MRSICGCEWFLNKMSFCAETLNAKKVVQLFSELMSSHLQALSSNQDDRQQHQPCQTLQQKAELLDLHALV